MTIRVDKYLASLGVCSRRDVAAVLEKRQLVVNGTRILEPGVRVDPTMDEVRLDGRKLLAPKLVYFLLHKPLGVISTAEDELGRNTVTSLVRTAERVYPIGRLDRDTSGLILLTNDGELTNLLTHPRYHVPKTYRLRVNGAIPLGVLRAFREGVRLDDGMTAPAEARIIAEKHGVSVLDVTLYEGRNRQIRRMCEALGLPLRSLQRIKFGPLSLGSLREGAYRQLTQQEIMQLRDAAGQKQ